MSGGLIYLGPVSVTGVTLPMLKLADIATARQIAVGISETASAFERAMLTEDEARTKFAALGFTPRAIERLIENRRKRRLELTPLHLVQS